jgi:hypothetical protein
MRPKWGKVLVLGKHRQMARAILSEFLDQPPEKEDRRDSGEDRGG